MNSKIKTALTIVGLLGLYLSFWPVPVDPKSWQAPVAPAFEGIYKPNSALADFEALPLEGLTGPEAVTQNSKGELFAATHEGWIVRWTEQQAKPQRWIDVGGRPLGIAFDSADNLWVANAYTGLQKVTANGEISLVTDMAEGVPIRYADDLVVLSDGRAFFSDASTKFSAEQSNSTLAASLLDIMEHGGHGRILEYDPNTGLTKVVMSGLNFANGVTASEQEDFLLVAETGGYRVWKYWLKGEQAGQSEVIADNLPGFPDNVHIGKNGRFWVGFTTIRTPILDKLSDKPFVRKVVQRLPAFVRPNVQPYGHIIAIDGDGKVLHSLQDPEGAYPATTGAWESKDYLYVSSLTAPVLARLPKADLGLE